ncbi:hypothetical protein RCL1_006177 [Eukaryota sp. TZLM3-RCL]
MGQNSLFKMKGHFPPYSSKNMTSGRAPRYSAVDGNWCAANVAYSFTDTAFSFPITPATPMNDYMEVWSHELHRKNIFDEVLGFYQLQSEGGVAGALHGAAVAGALTTTCTCSQGLLLMVPEAFKLAGELLPTVFHVAARAISGQAMTIYSDHSDVMAMRQTGFAFLSSGCVQEINDFATVAHIASLESSVPFLHFFEGMRLSHEVNKVDVFSQDELKSLFPYEALRKFRTTRTMSVDRPTVRGGVENSDIFWQIVQAAEPYFKAVPGIVEAAFEKIYQLCGRRYNLFDYFGAHDAEDVVILMGAGAETVEQVTHKLVEKGEKVGMIKVRLFRPFSVSHLIAALPSTVKRIAVLDRTKEPGSAGEPLYLDVNAAVFAERPHVKVYGGIYGLGGKTFAPEHALSVFRFLSSSSVFNGFTVNLNDDLLNTNIPVVSEIVDTIPQGTKECVFIGLASDGTIGANKEAIKMISDETEMFVQGYFEYDAKKSGGFTISHLRFGPSHIRAEFAITSADYVACHHPSYVSKFNLLKYLTKGGVFVLNAPQTSLEQLETTLPASFKRALAAKQAKFYVIDAAGIAESVGLKGRVNMIMQTVFFYLSEVLPIERAMDLLKQSVRKTFGRKGEDVVNFNINAIDRTVEAIQSIKYPSNWETLEVVPPVLDQNSTEWVNNVVIPVLKMEGDDLPVSMFTNVAGGAFPTNTTKIEKRNTTVSIPVWDSSRCISCNECVAVCAHASIRPFVLDPVSELEGIKLKGGPKGEDWKFRIQVSPFDCYGCSACASACPKDALTMVNADEQLKEVEARNWETAINAPKQSHKFSTKTVRDTQFQEPMIEFSGACAGCSETMYMKMLTQLVGNRLHCVNSCGCSLVIQGMAPALPQTVDERGRGPAVLGTLFEDTAEVGFGQTVVLNRRRQTLIDGVEKNINEAPESLSEVLTQWLADAKSGATCVESADRVSDAIVGLPETPLIELIKTNESLLRRPSSWIFGGDGWAYDIGSGGLSHVLASGENVKILIFDTEVYSNTGGQVSKATSRGAQARFAVTGKNQRKKDLGLEILLMKDVYVASVAIGANSTQTLKAFKEAEEFDGPAVILAYCPCLNHGIKKGLGTTLEQAKLAVDSGYWPLYRYNPALATAGKSPLSLDSKKLKRSVRDLLSTEVRWTAVQQSNPEMAERFAAELEGDIMLRNAMIENFKAFYDGLIAK